ncbi:hypothetical protein FQN53_000532 [Emmonsiellopsis sp. PD_33]|nr:hypothetical protein FQN53_000532 [Emmonsiellopsis sp. PD_33]
MSCTLEQPTFLSSVRRNVHIYKHDGTILGGIFQNGSLTHQHLYNMCPLFLQLSNMTWHIFTLNPDGSTGHQLGNDATNIAPGNYTILGPMFNRDVDGVDGRALELPCRDPNEPNRVSDDLLRWHFHMAVLANMRGPASEPFWETDFPEGDMMGEILEGPYASERMELELIERLGYGEGVY